MLRHITLMIALALPLAAQAQLLRLNQGWTINRTNQVYRAYLGSQLMPLEWFKYLELPDSTRRFMHNADAYGLMNADHVPGRAQGPAAELPLGFAVGDDEETAPLYGESRWVGINCAACHTTVLNINGSDVLVEGAGSRFNMHKFQRDLLASVRATLTDNVKFERFRARQSPRSRANLRGYMEHFVSDFSRHIRVNHTAHGVALDHGPGRIDGKGPPLNEFGCSMDRLGDQRLARELLNPANCRVPHPPSDNPYVWGMTETEWNQYTGETHTVFGRNLGAMTAAFGRKWVEAGPNGKPVYRTTVPVAATDRIDRWYDELTSPDWNQLHRLRLVPAIDHAKAGRGRQHYQRHCMSCHAIQPEFTEPNMYGYSYWKVNITPVEEVGTDRGLHDAEYDRRATLPPSMVRDYVRELGRDRLKADNDVLATDFRNFVVMNMIGEMFNRAGLSLLDQLRVSQCRDGRVQTKRGYKARSLEGVVLTAPFLHNGSVPTLDDLMRPPAERPRAFYIGCKDYDVEKMGLKCNGTEPHAFRLDTRLPGNSNAGHEYGTNLSAQQRSEVIEFLKTLQMPQRPPQGPQASITCGDL